MINGIPRRYNWVSLSEPHHRSTVKSIFLLDASLNKNYMAESYLSANQHYIKYMNGPLKGH